MKYYAVKIGKTPGIYMDWDTCEEQVKGYSGAKYKSFKTKEEAEVYMSGDTPAKEIPAVKPVENDVIAEALKSHPVAFVDGSFLRELSSTCVGSGAYILMPNGDTVSISKCVDDELFAEMCQVGGEMKAAELAIREVRHRGYSCVMICYDYKGIACWPTGEWKAKNEFTQAYRDAVQNLNSSIKVVFHKVKAHSGNRYNDKADKLAKQAIIDHVKTMEG